MIKIAITQRISEARDYVERRDSLDQRWIPLLLAHDIWPILVPNNTDYVTHLCKHRDIDGILFSGGENLIHYNGLVPERDETERILLEWAIDVKLPVVGVCRGMQLIQDYFGGKLTSVKGHTATRHRLSVNPDSRYEQRLNSFEDVNAYHGLGAFDSVDELRVSARSEDNVIMAVEHTSLPIFGQMWHPERETLISLQQVALLKHAMTSL
jgi:N5-(cytidine 5'-diphosphoramidyl)-L-glutamine hydrolase